MKKLLVVIDMQTDFVTGVLGSPQAVAAVEPIRQKLERYTAAGNPILFTMDTHREEDYTRPDKTRESAVIPKHCIEGTEGWQIVPELRSWAANTAITKPTFLSPTLAGEIRGRFGEDVEIELCGVCTDICVVSNALALRGAFPASRILVDAACCAGVTPESHGAALLVMKSCLVEVI